MPTTERERDSKNGFFKFDPPTIHPTFSHRDLHQSCFAFLNLSLLLTVVRSLRKNEIARLKFGMYVVRYWMITSSKFMKNTPLEACTYDVHSEGDQEISLFGG